MVSVFSAAIQKPILRCPWFPLCSLWSMLMVWLRWVHVAVLWRSVQAGPILISYKSIEICTLMPADQIWLWILMMNSPLLCLFFGFLRCRMDHISFAGVLFSFIHFDFLHFRQFFVEEWFVFCARKKIWKIELIHFSRHPLMVNGEHTCPLHRIV